MKKAELEKKLADAVEIIRNLLSGYLPKLSRKEAEAWVEANR